jgi:hypothetical protein
MISLTAGYDIIINAANNETVIPSIQAAIHNGAHYCDMAWAQVLEQAMQLAPSAEAAGITAIIATGISPCISNLMGVHAARQLDDVEQLQVGRAEFIDFASAQELTPQQWFKKPKDNIAVLAEYKPFLAWVLQRLQENGSQNMRAYYDGQWGEIDPIKSGLDVPLAQGDTSIAHPFFSGNDYFGMLPRDLARLSPAEIYFSPLPPQLDGLLREQALQILEGKIDSDKAVNSFFETVESDPHHWLTLPDDFIPISKLWVRALGHKDGRAAQYTCWFTAPMWEVDGYFLTSVALVAAVHKVLRGEIREHGVFTAEKVFDPQSFFDEVVAILPDPPPDGKLINESFEWLQ